MSNVSDECDAPHHQQDRNSAIAVADKDDDVDDDHEAVVIADVVDDGGMEADDDDDDDVDIEGELNAEIDADVNVVVDAMLEDKDHLVPVPDSPPIHEPMTLKAVEEHGAILEAEITAAMQDIDRSEHRKRPAAKSFLRKEPPSRTLRPKTKAATAAGAVMVPVQSKAASREATTKTKTVKRKVVKKKSPAKGTAKSKSKINMSRSLDPMVAEGIPDEAYPGGGDWPPGWKKRVYQRRSGASKGHLDRYWYTPQLQVKLRSMPEIQRWLEAMKQTDGNEEESKKLYKNITL